MKINPDIKKTLSLIGKEAVDNGNTPDGERRYHRKMLQVFKHNLSEEEQLYILKTVLEFVHYRTITTDPDNILSIHNIKLRSWFFVFLAVISGTLAISTMFGFVEGGPVLVKAISNVLSLINL